MMTGTEYVTGTVVCEYEIRTVVHVCEYEIVVCEYDWNCEYDDNWNCGVLVLVVMLYCCQCMCVVVCHTCILCVCVCVCTCILC